MEIKTREFKQGSRRAVKNVRVQQAARRATGNLLRERNNAAANLPEWEDLRNRAREIKAHTIERLDEYLAQFADAVERAGGKVVWASYRAGSFGLRSLPGPGEGCTHRGQGQVHGH